jgi:hypothetical protein
MASESGQSRAVCWSTSLAPSPRLHFLPQQWGPVTGRTAGQRVPDGPEGQATPMASSMCPLRGLQAGRDPKPGNKQRHKKYKYKKGVGWGPETIVSSVIGSAGKTSLLLDYMGRSQEMVPQDVVSQFKRCPPHRSPLHILSFNFLLVILVSRTPASIH